MKYRVTAFLLCLVLMLTPVSAFATESADDSASTYASYYFTDYLGYIYDKGNGTINIVFDTTAKKDIDKLGASYIELQRYVNGSWTFVKSFSSSSTDGMLETNTWSVASYVTVKNLAVGGKYRAIIVFYAEDDNIVDRRTYTTSSVILS